VPGGTPGVEGWSTGTGGGAVVGVAVGLGGALGFGVGAVVGRVVGVGAVVGRGAAVVGAVVGLGAATVAGAEGTGAGLAGGGDARRISHALRDRARTVVAPARTRRVVVEGTRELPRGSETTVRGVRDARERPAQEPNNSPAGQRCSLSDR